MKIFVQRFERQPFVSPPGLGWLLAPALVVAMLIVVAASAEFFFKVM